MKNKLFDLYTDYLTTSFGQTSATGLSQLVDGEVNHDQVTPFLSSEDLDSKALWKRLKKEVREVEDENGVLIFDDSVQVKSHS